MARRISRVSNIRVVTTSRKPKLREDQTLLFVKPSTLIKYPKVRNAISLTTPSILTLSSRLSKPDRIALRLPVKLSSGKIVSRQSFSKRGAFSRLNDKAVTNRVLRVLHKNLLRANQQADSPTAFTVKRVLPFLSADGVEAVLEAYPDWFEKTFARGALLRKVRSLSLKDLTQALSFTESGSVPAGPKNKPYNLSSLLVHDVYPHVASHFDRLPRSMTPKTLQESYPVLRKSSTFLRFATLTLSTHLAKWVAVWYRFTYLYLRFGTLPHVETYLRARKAEKLTVNHNLIFRFNQHRLVVALVDDLKRKTHFFLSPGLLLKYFQRKKSLKKNKSMKLLMARFLRKILLVLGARHLTLRLKGIPLFIDILLNMLFRPLSHLFTDPFTGNQVDEIQNTKGALNIATIVITKHRPFGYQKQKKKGRVKRKIRRKLTRLNSVID